MLFLLNRVLNEMGFRLMWVIVPYFWHYCVSWLLYLLQEFACTPFHNIYLVVINVLCWCKVQDCLCVIIESVVNKTTYQISYFLSIL